MNKLESQNVGESSQTLKHPLGESSQALKHPPGVIPLITPIGEDQHASIAKKVVDQSTNSTYVAALSIQQLQDMITNSIRVQYGGTPQRNLMYVKPNTKRIDDIRMPAGYQPPKFQQFDKKGNPK